MSKTKRQSGIELLRIIVMMQIIFLHAYQYGLLHNASKAAGDIDGTLVTFVWSFCRAPVDVFIMISEYFMITSQFDIKKTIRRSGKIYGAMIFYSIVLSIIFFISDPSLININSVISAFTPLMSRTWYFLSNYLIILLLSPFLNKMLASLSKKHYLYFMGIVFVVVSLWSTLAEIDGVSNVISVNKVLDPYMGKSLSGFLLMYIIGGYLRLFVKQQPLEKRKLNFKYLGIFAALCVSDFVLASVFPQYKPAFGMFNNPLVLAESAMLILFFRDFNFSSKFVNTVAGTTLGVYAIHENPYVRDCLWHVANFSNKHLYDTLIYIPIVIITVILIFAGCSIIELLRLKLFEFVGNKINARKTVTSVTPNQKAK